MKPEADKPMIPFLTDWTKSAIEMNLMTNVVRIFIFIIFLPGFILAQPPELQFEKISIEQGLSQSTITQIVQD